MSVFDSVGKRFAERRFFAAGILGATSDNDAKPRRDDIQPFGHILPGAMQAAARAFWAKLMFSSGVIADCAKAALAAIRTTATIAVFLVS